MATCSDIRVRKNISILLAKGCRLPGMDCLCVERKTCSQRVSSIVLMHTCYAMHSLTHSLPSHIQTYCQTYLTPCLPSFFSFLLSYRYPGSRGKVPRFADHGAVAKPTVRWRPWCSCKTNCKVEAEDGDVDWRYRQVNLYGRQTYFSQITDM